MLVIKTKQFQKDLSKVIKGCTFGVIPISSMIGIKVKDNELFLLATDQFNYIQVSSKLDGKSKDFDVAIPADKFYKLIRKMTTENIILTLKESYLEVKGDGKNKAIYKIEIPLDGENFMKSPILPEIREEDITEKGQIEQKEFKAIIKNNKFSVPKDNNLNSSGYYYGGYYCGENVVTSNGKIAAIYEIKLFKTPYLFCKEALELIDSMDSEIIMYQRNNDIMLLISDSVKVYTLELDKKSAYPVDVINNYFNEIETESKCVLSKQELNQVIDRVSLFITEADNKPLKMNFNKRTISISNKKDSSLEDIEYMSVTNFNPYTCLVNFENLQVTLAVQSDEISVIFGDPNVLKFIGDKTKHLSSLIFDEFVSEESEFDSEDVEEETFVQDDLTGEDEIPFN